MQRLSLELMVFRSCRKLNGCWIKHGDLIDCYVKACFISENGN